MHGGQRFECGSCGVEDFCGITASGTSGIAPAGDQYVSVHKQRCSGTSSFGGHFRERRKFSGGGIVNFCGVCFAVTNPAAHNENFAGVQQDGGVTDAWDGHVASGPKFSGDGIIEFSGAIKILIASHAADDDNLAV